jgi:hypothetical protein
MAAITGLDVQEMVRHWLQTPINAYHGSNYGCDPKSLLQNPQSIGVADAFLKKLKKDVPVLSALPANSVNLYAVPSGVDRLDIFIDVAGTALQIEANT